jgi:hypothetical protein
MVVNFNISLYRKNTLTAFEDKMLKKVFGYKRERE